MQGHQWLRDRPAAHRDTTLRLFSEQLEHRAAGWPVNLRRERQAMRKKMRETVNHYDFVPSRTRVNHEDGEVGVAAATDDNNATSNSDEIPQTSRAAKSESQQSLQSPTPTKISKARSPTFRRTLTEHIRHRQSKAIVRLQAFARGAVVRAAVAAVQQARKNAARRLRKFDAVKKVEQFQQKRAAAERKQHRGRQWRWCCCSRCSWACIHTCYFDSTA